MKTLQPLKTGDSWNVLYRLVNDLVTAVNSLLQQRPGPGLARTSAGQVYALARPAAPTAGSEVSGDPKKLVVTQGSLDEDTYDRGTDNKPVSLNVVTDIRYDPAAHKMQMAYREIVATGIKTVSAEPTWVDITTAIKCPTA
mgnify:CR=1 FL=1